MENTKAKKNISMCISNSTCVMFISNRLAIY